MAFRRPKMQSNNIIFNAIYFNNDTPEEFAVHPFKIRPNIEHLAVKTLYRVITYS